MKHYIKKASKQDVERTTIVNARAISDFFEIDLKQRDDAAIIKLKYVGEDEYQDINFVQKQDPRIFLDRDRFEEDDILLFTQEEDGKFLLDIIKPSSDLYDSISDKLVNNYLITDDLSGVTTDEILEDPAYNDIKYGMKHPLNQILFGPPGTGKTDSTVEIALDILGRKTEDRVKNRVIFRSLLNKRIFFVTMHSSYSYEDFVQGIKPKTSEKGELLFEPRDGIFKKVADKARYEYKSKKHSENSENEIDFDTIFRFAFKPLIEEDEPVLIKRENTDFRIISINERTLKFETSTGNTGPTYNLSKKTIEKIFEKGENDIILSGNKGYFDGVLEFLKGKKNELVELLKTQEFNNINYVLILDEINRANISKVFGELITLLESDKRIGEESELSVTLPSGEEFSVPPNLYVIGTMNTADKSIALVDIALRRRFQFKPVYPDAKVIRNYSRGSNINGRIEFFNKLNSKLRDEKTVDFQIGHSYFLRDNSLEEVINENVIPLLTEYYRNDLKKVKEILSELDVNIDQTYYSETGLLKVNT